MKLLASRHKRFNYYEQIEMNEGGPNFQDTETLQHRWKTENLTYEQLPVVVADAFHSWGHCSTSSAPPVSKLQEPVFLAVREGFLVDGPAMNDMFAPVFFF